MRVGEEWQEIAIVNVSAGGLMAKADVPPPQGSEVEIRRRGLTIMAKVLRTSGRRFAMQAHEPIDLDSLLAKSGIDLKAADGDAPPGKGWAWHWRGR